MSKTRMAGKWALIAVLVALLAAGIVGCCLLFFGNIANVLVLEAGGSVTASDFKLRNISTPVRFVSGYDRLDTAVPGDYPVELEYCGFTYSSVIRVVDTKKPAVTTKDVVLFATQEPAAEDFFQQITDHTAVTVDFLKAPDMGIEGAQTVYLTATDLGGNVTRAEATLSLIFDTQPPVLEGPDALVVYLGFPVDVTELVTLTDDLDPNPVLTIDADGVDQSTPGGYDITYRATDICGNATEKKIHMTVVHDTQGPQILGVLPKSLYQGSTISYRNGVLVQDDYDNAPVLSIDSSEVDLSQPGTYSLTYTASDAAGNKTTLETTVTVKKKSDNYVEEAVIYAKADELLAKIVDEDMTPQEQVEAIFDWATSHCVYRGTKDKTDRLQAAYVMMKNRVGDCYNYYAMCSLFFERLGLPNLEIKRSADSVRRTRHWWNMVSIDGGETYYHFDACPQSGFNIDVCLATDAVLDRCNRYTPGYYTYDKELFPPTPEEAP